MLSPTGLAAPGDEGRPFRGNRGLVVRKERDREVPDLITFAVVHQLRQARRLSSHTHERSGPQARQRPAPAPTPAKDRRGKVEAAAGPARHCRLAALLNKPKWFLSPAISLILHHH
jgi:hypothetical protein